MRASSPPILDLTPDGRFVAPPPPGPLDRLLARAGAAFALAALALGGLTVAALALVVVGLLLPLAVAAGLIAAGVLWWRLRRLRRQGLAPSGGVVVRRA